MFIAFVTTKARDGIITSVAVQIGLGNHKECQGDDHRQLVTVCRVIS